MYHVITIGWINEKQAAMAEIRHTEEGIHRSNTVEGENCKQENEWSNQKIGRFKKPIEYVSWLWKAWIFHFGHIVPWYLCWMCIVVHCLVSVIKLKDFFCNGFKFVTLGFKAKPNDDTMCAQESSLHTYHIENGYRIISIKIYNIYYQIMSYKRLSRTLSEALQRKNIITPQTIDRW
jgi:hypothetical protein